MNQTSGSGNGQNGTWTVTETTTEARAGETGGHMRSVLFLGTFAVAAIFAGLIVYYFT